MSNNHISIRLMLVVAGVIVLSTAATQHNLFNIAKFAQTDPTQKQMELKEFDNPNGHVTINPEDAGHSIPVGGVSTIDLGVTLRGKETSGYTIPVEYDSDHYRYSGVENVDTRFDLYVRTEDPDYVVLVAVKQPTNAERIVLNNARVAKVKFTSIVGGVSKVTLGEKTPKGYSLKLVDIKNEASLPSYGQVQIVSK